MQYRREIDGLRALAVIPVVFFHAGLKSFSGGFIGVDVFFVISGYLISSIIINEIDGGQFSIANFYERRARRILPALFLVIFSCLPVAWMLLLPSDMKTFGQSLISVSLFTSNLFFWKKSNYFDASAELNPLLHTWSLSVEEQFYLAYPLLLLGMRGFRRQWLVTLLIAITICSLGLAHWGAFRFPKATFFLLQARAWELGIGALAALHLHRHPSLDSEKGMDQALSAFGLGLIFLGVLHFTEDTPFPSLYALVPTLGTALIILFATPHTLVGRLLGSRVLVGIGLISYSAYLWHQPLFALARHGSLGAPPTSTYMALIVATFLLAYISWRFVEQRFRKQKNGLSRRFIFGFSVAGLTVIATFGLLCHFSEGYMGRRALAVQFAPIEGQLQANKGLAPTCDGNPSSASACRTSDHPEVLLWGDSYAMHLASGLLASRPEIRLAQMTLSMCGPVLGAAPLSQRLGREWATDCLKRNEEVMRYIRQTRSIRYVVLGSPFKQYIEEDQLLLLKSGQVVRSQEHGRLLLEQTIDELRALGVHPVIFSPTPQNGRNIGRCLAKAIQFGAPMEQCDISVGSAASQQESITRLLQSLEKKAKVVWLKDGLCDDTICKTHVDNILLYRDEGHLTRQGSAYLGTRMNFYSLLMTQQGPAVGPENIGQGQHNH